MNTSDRRLRLSLVILSTLGGLGLAVLLLASWLIYNLLSPIRDSIDKVQSQQKTIETAYRNSAEPAAAYRSVQDSVQHARYIPGFTYTPETYAAAVTDRLTYSSADAYYFEARNNTEHVKIARIINSDRKITINVEFIQ